MPSKICIDKWDGGGGGGEREREWLRGDEGERKRGIMAQFICQTAAVLSNETKATIPPFIVNLSQIQSSKKKQ